MNYRKCVILLFDGARFDVWSELLAAGRLPNISRYILADGSFLKGYSTLPTTTGPAHIPFLYGVFAGKAGVPGIRWFDKSRSGRRIFTPRVMRSYVGVSCFAMGSDIGENYVPLYDYFDRPVNVFGHLDAHRSSRLRSNRWQKTIHYIRAHKTNEWEVVDKAAAQAVRKHLAEGADFVFSLFPGIDELTHLCHPTHERVLNQYRRLDDAVGEIVQSLPTEDLSETIFFIVSDHGLTRTHTHVPLVDISEESGFTPIYFPRIRRRNFDMAILESGNAIASIYLMDPVRDRPALYNELMSVEKNRRFLERLLQHEGVDYVAYRVDDSVLGVGSSDGELLMDFAQPGFVNLTLSGANPLQFGIDGGRRNLAESINLTRETRYPDSLVQLQQLFASGRTGDLVVFPREGFDLRARYEWPEHKSSHGSLLREHMEVPVCTNLKLAASSCRTVDVFSTVLAHLGHEVSGAVDGCVLE
ncbi:MAG: alkaline phosphatase family protein [Candidatus Eisenbacteria bacterium]|nr:alkaline phosphatase family protein [Candidatus Eisenbacteria bacterium]